MKIDRLMQMVFASTAVCVAAPAFAGSLPTLEGASSRCDAARVGGGSQADQLCGGDSDDDDGKGDEDKGDEDKDGKDDGDSDDDGAEPASF